MLRTGRPWADARYRQDDDPFSAHFAAFAGIRPDAETVLAVGSVLPEWPEWEETPRQESGWSETPQGAWRVRGMATRRDLRGSGLGSSILACLLDHVRSEGGGLVWCTARTGALTFYERAGFCSRGEPSHVPGIGPHLTMWLEID